MKAFWILAITAALACNRNPNRVFEQIHDLPASGWSWDQPVTFTIDIADTVQRYNLQVFLRHAGNYKYSNCFMRLSVLAPDERTVEQRIELVLANKKGEWLGEGTGDRRHVAVTVGQDLLMKVPGTYTFTLHQDMRDDPLKGVLDVGLFLEKSSAGE